MPWPFSEKPSKMRNIFLEASESGFLSWFSTVHMRLSSIVQKIIVFFLKKKKNQTKTKTIKLNRLVKCFLKCLKILIMDLATQTLARLHASSNAEYLTLRAKVLGLIFSFRLNSRSAVKGRRQLLSTMEQWKCFSHKLY